MRCFHFDTEPISEEYFTLPIHAKFNCFTVHGAQDSAIEVESIAVIVRNIFSTQGKQKDGTAAIHNDEEAGTKIEFQFRGELHHVQQRGNVRECSISNEIGHLCGVVETEAFPAFGGSRSVSLVGCSFNSQTILGTDGIGLSLTRTARKNNDEVGMISSSLISCSFVNVSSIGCSCPPHVSELSQTMLGCVVSLSSSHLSGSTIRDVNTGGSVLCSNSSFSSFLSSPNTDSNADSDASPSITLPNGTHREFVDDGTEYSFNNTSGDESSIASFSHCHFTGANYASNVHPLSFINYPGTITISSCSFSDYTFISGSYLGCGGMVYINQYDNQPHQPVYVEASNFTNLKTDANGAGMSLIIQKSVTVVDCRFEKCGPAGQMYTVVGGMYVRDNDPSSVFTIANLVFESCCATQCGGMEIATYGTVLLSDCLFDDCFIVDEENGFGGLVLVFGKTLTSVTRLNFTDCRSPSRAPGMAVSGTCDYQLTDIHLLRCKPSDESKTVCEGGLDVLLEPTLTLTVQDCSFIECSTIISGAAFHAYNFGSCVISDCLVKDCYSGATGAISLQQLFEDSPSISLTRVAFINNSVGHTKNEVASVYVPDDAPGFVDVCVTAYSDEAKPTISIVDCFTTCPTASMGMGVNERINEEERIRYRINDDAFHNIWPVLTREVELSFDGLSGRMMLGMKVKVPNSSQKYEVTIRNEVDKTEVKGVIEFVDGKATMTSPSPTFNLDFSTSYRITSIVGIVSSSPSPSSSLSNALSFPPAAWAFNLAATPTFVSFTTPTPPTLVSATAHLVSSDQPLAFVLLVIDRVVSGSYCCVVEEDGKDVSVLVHFDGSSVTGGSSEIVVIGEDRLLTHDTSYTIKGITPTPETESPFVRMNGPIAFHIPKSSFVAPTRDHKKAMSPEMKKLLSWLIPVVICVCVALIVIIVVIVLVNRRRSKGKNAKSEMEEQEPVEDEKMIECGRNDLIDVIGSDDSANCEVSEVNQEVNNNPSTLNRTDGSDMPFSKVMTCSGDFGVSTVRMNQTLYSVLHKEGKAIGKREIGIQIVNGLKEVVAHRGWSDVLTHLSSHWILLDSAGTVQLKLDMNTSEAEQETARQRQMQQVLSPMEGQQNEEDKPHDENQTMMSGTDKSGMDGLRWRAPGFPFGQAEHNWARLPVSSEMSGPTRGLSSCNRIVN
ncbi:hypothetical protein BLNAU_9870 [Blattamonas nauphoetae]|uniref:Right handed beta helix domain-containing protein n=1 Tax=Blattamonas nauphoetae TaxID=2049346 RepID=A0ABQ9XUK1_9EUKA|nr:hypothetical protein BLNAU_9870 [Blattamonas nauphoetae]